MKAANEKKETDWATLFNEIKATDLPQAAKVAQAFRWVTDRYVMHAEQELELLRALNDREALVKEQIKLNMMQHVRGVFRQCYRFMTEQEAWDE